MSATLQLFDRFKAAKNVDSDAAAGKLLGLKPSSVSNYRQGVRHAEPEVVRKMAIALGEDAELWVLKVQAERETIPARRAVWLRCIERLATAAVVCLAVYTSISSGDNSALAHAFVIGQLPNVVGIAHLLGRSEGPGRRRSVYV